MKRCFYVLDDQLTKFNFEISGIPVKEFIMYHNFKTENIITLILFLKWLLIYIEYIANEISICPPADIIFLCWIQMFTLLP